MQNINNRNAWILRIILGDVKLKIVCASDTKYRMKAMILAAGFGTRLFPLTIDRTKPAIPFLGKPLVGYVAGYIAKFGINEMELWTMRSTCCRTKRS
jgi:hypothetical protein